MSKEQQASLTRIPTTRAKNDEIFHQILEGKTVSREEAVNLICSNGNEAELLWSVAALMRTRGKGNIVSYSRKVFIPLTNLCRDRCGYCTFKKNPSQREAKTMSPKEVITVASAGSKYRCTEALFTLGERPEQRYTEAKTVLHNLGFSTTLEYLRYACEVVIEKTGLLPHANPGTMTKKEMRSLRDVNASMGLMLENVSERLCKPGGPHEKAPSKHPKLRLATIRNAGELKIAFTTGLLIGIGETTEEIVDSLYAIKELNDNFGHIQEIILQNFRAKENTQMANCAEPDHGFMRNVVAVARIILGQDMNVQVPPNLSPTLYPGFISSGINDWGGISPVTVDFVNPEAPWPKVRMVSRECAKCGFNLKQRLPIYPEFIMKKTGFVPEPLQPLVNSMIDSQGYVS